MKYFIFFFFFWLFEIGKGAHVTHTHVVVEFKPKLGENKTEKCNMRILWNWFLILNIWFDNDGMSVTVKKKGGFIFPEFLKWVCWNDWRGVIIVIHFPYLLKSVLKIIIYLHSSLISTEYWKYWNIDCLLLIAFKKIDFLLKLTLDFKLSMIIKFKMLRGYWTSYQKLACFGLYLKIINTLFEKW